MFYLLDSHKCSIICKSSGGIIVGTWYGVRDFESSYGMIALSRLEAGPSIQLKNYPGLYLLIGSHLDTHAVDHSS